MTWVREEYNFSLLERFFANVLRCGQIPQHLAIIMDGNRRYAKQNQVDKIEGHSQGFESLANTLQWCRHLGIHTVTVYAFSIENFKRDKEEVENLLQLFREKIRMLIAEEEKLREHGIRVNIIGDLKLLPEDVQQLIASAIKITEDNNKFTLNVAFSYTSREEITSAMRESVSMVERGEISVQDIDVPLLDSLMYTSASPKVDLLLRTSGECRLSDFMLWQATSSITYFTKVLWPEFRYYHLLLAVFFYQRNIFLFQKLTAKECLE
jgi:ditrans,polycis-polyprenyl diphosphate synthase